ncbi:MAG: LPXTG cell wall anchor domain-containing protein [Deltaproteobacteria bacterium]|nr:LPXTG cell wall anchor domain-containing protein [Deltaproteobacteria bacterium]
MTFKECVADKAKSWAEENPSIARAPKLGRGAASSTSGGGEQTKQTGGCSVGDGALAGVLFVGSALVALRRRRRRAA